ncbi:MAG: ribose transport system substrate-binding protein [Solirubrobacteraceae bacterium]|jgi:ABC-type sugar transport system substrate-binding protein|nr:ribose transport system substrate-binding protein [Solirubrobacteraceae bacterium]
MTTPRDPLAGDMPDGELLDRRAVLRAALRAGAGAALGLGLPAALAGCGGGDKLNAHSKAVARRSIAIDYASYYAPIDDLRRLVLARARGVGAAVTFSDDAAGARAQLASLRTLTGARGGFRVVVIAAFDAGSVEPIAAAALRDGIEIVTYVTPLQHRTAAIDVDPARTGALLATHAARWARARLGGRGTVLLVVPPAGVIVPDPFVAGAARSEPAIRSTLAARAPGLRIATTAGAYGTPDARQAVAQALGAHPGARIVLCWNDATAVGAAQALRDGHPAGERARLYAGGQGAPAIAARATLERLHGDDVLRCLVAPRLRDLANALVDVPRSLLRGEPARDIAPPIAVLTAGSSAVRAYERDYAPVG